MGKKQYPIVFLTSLHVVHCREHNLLRNLLKCQAMNNPISNIIFIIHQLQYATLLVVNILSLILLMFILVLNSQSRLQVVLLNTTLFDA